MDARQTRIEEIRQELHKLANTYAIDDNNGTVAVALHQAASELLRPLRMIKEGPTEEDRQENMDRWLAGQIAQFGPLDSL